MSDTPTLEDLIAKAMWNTNYRSDLEDMGGVAAVREIADHVAAVIREHWHIVAKVEPTDTYDHLREVPMLGWEVEHGPYFIQALPPGEVGVEYNGEPEEPMSATSTRAFAAALLSAADRAEAK